MLIEENTIGKRGKNDWWLTETETKHKQKIINKSKLRRWTKKKSNNYKKKQIQTENNEQKKKLMKKKTQKKCSWSGK